ncbi:hypothetical protein [Apilactobacillus xinyiensis]|uniref:hypothetical protein n=1 Tax=Apilactobacillus xinyiensis TaxID=2841032 RepID=UPI00336517F6
MNIWTKKSIALANQEDYLDQLYKVYPMTHNIKRSPSDNFIEKINNDIKKKDNIQLVKDLLTERNLPFPVKDSYVSFLRRDKSSLERNPQTVNRLSGIIYEMGIDQVKKNMSKPIETNRQIGPLFKEWIKNGYLGVNVTRNPNEFLSFDGNIIYNDDDKKMKEFAEEHLGYDRKNKGLDFIGKFNKNYIIGESKFLTDFGGHQNAQMEDALSTLRYPLRKTNYSVKRIAILDGVVYLENNGKMNRLLKEAEDDEVILSSLLLRDYLYSI